MSILAGCHEARNNFVLKEIACPECDEYIELFVRDGKMELSIIVQSKHARNFPSPYRIASPHRR